MQPLIVTAAIIADAGRILITRRKAHVPYPNLWEFPGGKLEPMEDPRECVRREIREELGIEVEADSVFDVIYYRYPERPVLVLAYRCRWLSGEVADLDVAEHRWESPDRLAGYDFLPADGPLVQRIAAELG